MDKESHRSAGSILNDGLFWLIGVYLFSIRFEHFLAEPVGGRNFCDLIIRRKKKPVSSLLRFRQQRKKVFELFSKAK